MHKGGVLVNSKASLATLVSVRQELGPVSCQEIEVFRLNQRLSENPKYAEIKESIKSGEQKQPLHIVFHPTEQKWVLSQGGQTRLRILWELYEETGDDEYLYPKIIKEEYTSDLDLCVSHMIENNMRADNTFYEAATAIVNIRNLILKESGAAPTQEELVIKMTEKGMNIRRQSVTAMLYLAADLGPHISNERFLNEVSRKLIDLIRSLKKKSDLTDEEYDISLIEHINNFGGKITAATIKEHFFGRPAKNQTSQLPHKIAQDLAQSWGLEGLVEQCKKHPSNFTLTIPDNFDDKNQAKLFILLACFTGHIFDGEATLGMKGSGCDPSKTLETACNLAGITERELLEHQSSFFYRADENEFESFVQLIAEIRKNNRGK